MRERIISDFVMIIGLSILAACFIVITNKVSKIVWHDDKILPLMMSFLSATVISQVFNFLFDLVVLYKPESLISSSRAFNCSFIVFGDSPRLFLSLAVILSANKWVSFLIYIKVQIQAENKLLMSRHSHNQSNPFNFDQNLSVKLL